MTSPGAPGTAADRFRVPAPTVPVPREQADPTEPGRRTPGRHRAPPPPSPPTAAWWTVAVATGALVVACVAAIAVDVAPDASAAGVHGVQVPTVTRAQETAGPLEIPSIGASGAWSPPEETTTAVRPVTVAQTPVRTRRPAGTVQARTEALVTQEAPSEPTVTPLPQPVSVTLTDSPTPSAVTVEVTVEVTGP